MSTPTITPYRSEQRPGRDDFPHLLRSEWTKFRSVRGWVIAMIAAALLTALAVVAIASSANGKQNPGAHPTVAIGPDGEAVTDSFYFESGSASAKLISCGRTTRRQAKITPGKSAIDHGNHQARCMTRNWYAGIPRKSCVSSVSPRR